MMPAILAWMEAAKARFKIPAGHCLEIGSLNVNGTPRTVFPDATSYLGIDLAPGPGVDWVVDATDLGYTSLCVTMDTAICCETLEHTVRPWDIVATLKAALKPGGHLWVSTPTYGFPLHRFPLDCYRFGEDAYRHWIFADLMLLDLGTVHDELGQPAIVAVGRKML